MAESETVFMVIAICNAINVKTTSSIQKCPMCVSVSPLHQSFIKHNAFNVSCNENAFAQIEYKMAVYVRYYGVAFCL